MSDHQLKPSENCTANNSRQEEEQHTNYKLVDRSSDWVELIHHKKNNRLLNIQTTHIKQTPIQYNYMATPNTESSSSATITDEGFNQHRLPTRKYSTAKVPVNLEANKIITDLTNGYESESSSGEEQSENGIPIFTNSSADSPIVVEENLTNEDDEDETDSVTSTERTQELFNVPPQQYVLLLFIIDHHINLEENAQE